MTRARRATRRGALGGSTHEGRAGWAAGAAMLLTAALGGGCSDPVAPPAPPAVAPPPGTVLLVDGLPVGAAEVDRWVRVTSLLEPDKVPNHWRRLALANIVLPIRVAEALDPAGHRAAFAEGQRLRGLALELDRVPDDATHADRATVCDTAEGAWNDLGLVDWEIARELPVGSWSPLYETIGGYAFFRLLERPAEWGPLARVRIERVQVFFLAPDGVRMLVDDALRKLPIDIVDPEWEALVPPLYLQNSTRRTP